MLLFVLANWYCIKSAAMHKWVGIKTSSAGISYVELNGRLLENNYILCKTISSSSKLILAPKSISFKRLLIDLTILSPPR